MRCLIFGNGAEVRALADAGLPALLPVLRQQMPEIIHKFSTDWQGVLAVHPAFIMGWRAPAGTKVLFLEGFSRDPAIRAQAKARVGIGG